MKANKRRVELALARACMDTQDLSTVTGMPRPTINNAISGRGVRPCTLGKIAKALKVDVAELIDDEQ